MQQFGKVFIVLVLFYLKFVIRAKDTVQIGFLLNPQSANNVFHEALITHLVKGVNDKNPFFHIQTHIRYVEQTDGFRAKLISFYLFSMFSSFNQFL